MLLKSKKLIHPEAHKGINTWILYIALPAMVFKYLPNVKWNMDTLFPVFAMVIVLAGSWLWMRTYCKIKNYSRRSQSTLELVSGYSNTSFVAFPLIGAFFGEEYLKYAIISDQTMFILLSTFGIISAVKGGSNSGSVKANFIIKRLVTFPPFIACVLAIILPFFFSFNQAEPLFDKLAATVSPLALFSVGLQLKFKGWTKWISQITQAVTYKLVIAPALVLVFAILFGMKGDLTRITLFESAMPTVVSSSIIAEQFRLNIQLTNLTIGISIILSLLTSFIWFHIINYFC